MTNRSSRLLAACFEESSNADEAFAAFKIASLTTEVALSTEPPPANDMGILLSMLDGLRQEIIDDLPADVQAMQ